MKTLVGSDIGSYTFNASNGQITISGITALTSDEQILLVTNTTDNVMLYNFASPPGMTFSTSGDNRIIDLEYDTSQMSNSATLQIYLDLPRAQDVKVTSDVSTIQTNSLVTKAYDFVDISYGGNSQIAGGGSVPDGEINSITYKTGGSSGTAVTYLYFSYVSSGDTTVIDKIQKTEP